MCVCVCVCVCVSVWCARISRQPGECVEVRRFGFLVKIIICHGCGEEGGGGGGGGVTGIFDKTPHDICAWINLRKILLLFYAFYAG